MWRLALSALGVHTYLHRADTRNRTGDPFITSEVLYLLSYVGLYPRGFNAFVRLVRSTQGSRTTIQAFHTARSDPQRYVGHRAASSLQFF
jgi:hypothetical protein